MDETKNYYATVQHNYKMSDLKDNMRNQLAISMQREIKANNEKKPVIRPAKRVINDHHITPLKE